MIKFVIGEKHRDKMRVVRTKDGWHVYAGEAHVAKSLLSTVLHYEYNTKRLTFPNHQDTTEYIALKRSIKRVYQTDESIQYDYFQMDEWMIPLVMDMLASEEVETVEEAVSKIEQETEVIVE